MSVDKLVDSTQLDADLTSVANAIRTKGGTSASLAFPAEFVSAIAAIPSGGGGSDVIKQLVSLNTNGLYHATLDETLFFEKLTYVGEHGLQDLKTTRIAVFPVIGGTGKYPISDSSVLEIADFGASFTGNSSKLSTWYFSEDTALSTIILRRSSVIPVEAINVFNLTPFDSGKSGGTLYVPSSLISSYQSASNWSTILGYPNNSIVAIEGSQYENYWADGTPIS